jgi:hypothetical protein
VVRDENGNAEHVIPLVDDRQEHLVEIRYRTAQRRLQ